MYASSGRNSKFLETLRDSLPRDSIKSFSNNSSEYNPRKHDFDSEEGIQGSSSKKASIDPEKVHPVTFIAFLYFMAIWWYGFYSILKDFFWPIIIWIYNA